MLKLTIANTNSKNPPQDLPMERVGGLSYGDVVLWTSPRDKTPQAYLMVNLADLPGEGVGMAKVEGCFNYVYRTGYDTKVQRIGRLSVTQEGLDALVSQAKADYNNRPAI